MSSWFIFSIQNKTRMSCSNVCWPLERYYSGWSYLSVPQNQTKIQKGCGESTIYTSINTNRFFKLFTFLLFTFLLFTFLLFTFFVPPPLFAEVLDNILMILCWRDGPRFRVLAISREIVRTTSWLNYGHIWSMWLGLPCSIVLTSCTEYLRKWPKFEQVEDWWSVFLVSSSYQLAW